MKVGLRTLYHPLRIPVLCTFFLLLVSCAESKVKVISNTVELNRALSNLSGGEILKLKYSDKHYQIVLNIQKQESFSSPITITSFDEANPAVISYFFINRVNGLIIEDLEFVSNKKHTQERTSLLSINNSQNISVLNNRFKGSAESYASNRDEFKNDVGLFARSVKNLKIEANDISYLSFGITIFGGPNDTLNQNVRILNNEIHHIQGDGIRGVQVKDLIIKGNRIVNPLGSEQSVNHTDMIQFWTTNTTMRSENILIESNYLHTGTKAIAQSIFMRNEIVDSGELGSPMYYKNVTIKDNVIYGSHTHGITVGESIGLIITDNTVLPNFIKGSSIPTINVNNASKEVVIEGNIVFDSGVSSKYLNNLFIQRIDKNKNNYYDTLFLNTSAREFATERDILARPKSIIETGNWGARSTIIRNENDDVIIRPVVSMLRYPSKYQLSAAASHIPIVEERKNVKYQWVFDDGTTKLGETIQHSFKREGLNKVVLRALLVDSAYSEIVYIKVPSSSIYNLDDAHLLLNDEEKNEHTPIRDIQSVRQTYKISHKNSLVLDRRKIDIFNKENISFEIGLRSNYTTSVGELFSIHGAINIEILDTGVLRCVFVNNDDQEFVIETPSNTVKNGNWHHIVINYSNDDKVASLYLDGVNMDSQYVNGLTRKMEYWNPVIGSLYKESFEGELSVFSIRSETLNLGQIVKKHKAFRDEKSLFKG